MTWLKSVVEWIRSLGGGNGVLESAAMALVALLLASPVAIALVRFVIPRLLRFAREDEKPSAGRKARLAVVALLALTPVLVFLVDMDLDERPYGKSVVALTIMLVVYVATELSILGVAGSLARAGGAFPVLFRDIVRILVYLAAFVVVLHQIFEVHDLSALLGASAVFSIIVGLAVQEPLGNIFSGLFLQVDRPLKVGDWVRANGVEGRVTEINWRATKLVTKSNDAVSIPNSAISKADIVNFSEPTALHREQRRVGVSYATQPNKVKKALLELMLEVKGILPHPAPDVFLVEYGDSAIVYEMRYWVSKFGEAERTADELMTGVWYQFRRNGIEIPYPIRDVVVRREKRKEGVDPEVLDLLKKVDFLSPLKDEELRGLADDLAHHIYRHGENVFEQGEEGHTFYLIWSGHVGVRVKNDSGAEVEVAQLEHGNYFGEMSLLTGETRSASVIAKDDCDLLELDRSSFTHLLKTSPDVAEAMSSIIAHRMAATKAKVDEAERHTTRIVRKHADELTTMTKKILTGIRGIFGFKRG